MERIDYSDMEKVEVRVGTVIEVEDFPEAIKPMYIITADFGPEVGIRKSSGQYTQNYTKEEIMGRQIIGALNLGPKKIGPFVSEFLTLGLADEEGNAVLLSPTKKVPNGGLMF